MIPGILHIDTARDWRGGQQQAFYLHRGLINRGYRSRMICPPYSAMYRKCISENLPATVLPLRFEADLFSAFRLACYARREKYGILHAHSAHAQGIALFAKIFAGSSLHLIASRRVDFHLKKSALKQYKYRTSRLGRIVCISEGIRDILLSDGIPDEKMTVIHSGIDLHKFDGIISDPKGVRQEFGIPENHRLVCTVAALAGHKDYPNLIRAAEKVASEIPGVSFLAVGNGPMEKEIHAEAEQRVPGNRFVFAGFRDDVGRILKAADIFVLASRKEGLGTSIPDAQAAGLPTIGTDAGGIPEAIEHGVSGLIVPAKNPDALADALIRLLKDETLRRRFAESASESARRFDIEKTIEGNIRLYETITA